MAADLAGVVLQQIVTARSAQVVDGIDHRPALAGEAGRHAAAASATPRFGMLGDGAHDVQY